jgi:hypothetical protein
MDAYILSEQTESFTHYFADGLFGVTVAIGFIALFSLWLNCYQDFKMTTAAFRKLLRSK